MDEGDQVAGRSPRVAAQGFCFWNSGDPSARRYQLSAPWAGGPGGGGEPLGGTADSDRGDHRHGCPLGLRKPVGISGPAAGRTSPRCPGPGGRNAIGHPQVPGMRFRGCGSGAGRGWQTCPGPSQRSPRSNPRGGVGVVITFGWLRFGGGLGDRNRDLGRPRGPGTPTEGRPRAGEAGARARKRDQKGYGNRRGRFLRIESVLVRTNSRSPWGTRRRQRAPAGPPRCMAPRTDAHEGGAKDRNHDPAGRPRAPTAMNSIAGGHVRGAAAVLRGAGHEHAGLEPV